MYDDVFVGRRRDIRPTTVCTFEIGIRHGKTQNQELLTCIRISLHFDPYLESGLEGNIDILNFMIVYQNHEQNIVKSSIRVNPFLWVYDSGKFGYII